jgi:K+-transporting ATPase ATPase C chain
MLKELRPTIVLLVAFTIITGLIYPGIVTGIAQALFPHQAGGSLIVADGKIIGSELIGQNFTADRYFHGRLSAITTTDAKGNTVPDFYDATNSSASNLGPTSKALISRVQGDAAKLKAGSAAPIPVDLVTSSASGLDPEISPAGAAYQIARVAKAREVSEDKVAALVAAATTERTVGVLGEPRVNVLKLNMLLDGAAK